MQPKDWVCEIRYAKDLLLALTLTIISHSILAPCFSKASMSKSRLEDLAQCRQLGATLENFLHAKKMI